MTPATFKEPSKSSLVHFLKSLFKNLFFRVVIPILIFILAFICFILNSPAVFWSDFIQNKTVPIRLAMASGSLLKGSGLISVVSQNEKIPGVIFPGRFSWELKLSDIFAGKISVVILHARALAQPVYVSVSATKFTSSAIEARIPIGILQALGVPFSSLKIAGYADISLGPTKISAPSFLVKNAPLSVDEFDLKSIVYLQDRHTVGTPSNIGKYSISSNKKPSESLTVSVKSLAGPLIIEGDLKAANSQVFYNFKIKEDAESSIASSDLIKSLHGKYTGGIKLPFMLAEK